MTIHQLAAQGELALLSERLENYLEKVDKTDVQVSFVKVENVCVCLLACLSWCLSVCLSFCLSVSLSVCLCVCLSVSH